MRKKIELFTAMSADCFDQRITNRLLFQEPSRILILYGSVRERYYSLFTAEENYRLLMVIAVGVNLLNPPVYPCGMMSRYLSNSHKAARSVGVELLGAGWDNEHNDEAADCYLQILSLIPIQAVPHKKLTSQ